MSMTVQNVTYTGNDDNKKVRATEVGVVGGATVGGAKYSVGAFKRLKSVKVQDLGSLSTRTTENVKQAANAGKKIETLWSRISVNSKNFSKAISTWAKSTATGKVAQKIVNSKAFGKTSALVGGIGAVFVFISGIGEMGNTFNKLSQKPQLDEV